MKVVCGIAGESCPRGLDTCCGVCEHLHTCGEVCTYLCNHHDIPDKCPDAVVSGEVVPFQSAVPDTIQKISDLVKLKKDLEEQEKRLKTVLVEAMEKYGVKSFENDQVKFMYVAPGTKTSIDSARLKKEHPDIAEQYSKTSAVSAYVKVTVKGGDK